MRDLNRTVGPVTNSMCLYVVHMYTCLSYHLHLCSVCVYMHICVCGAHVHGRKHKLILTGTVRKLQAKELGFMGKCSFKRLAIAIRT